MELYAREIIQKAWACVSVNLFKSSSIVLN